MARQSINVWLSNSQSNFINADITPYITNMSFSTEVWKGYSDSTITINHAKMSAIPIGSLSGKSQMIIFVNNDLCWKGKIASLSSSTTETTINGIGGFSYLEDYTYDDGAFRYSSIFDFTNSDYPAEGSGGQLQLSSLSGRWGFATKCLNSLTFDTVLLSFALRLQRVHDEAAPEDTPDLSGFMTPFYSTDLSTFTYFETVEASSVSVDGYETFEFRATTPIVVPASSVFYVGIDCGNTDYMATANAYRHIMFNAETHGTPQTNSTWYYDDVVWTEQNTKTVTTFVVSDGKWNYSPGATQDVVIEDIFDEYSRKFAVTLANKVDFFSSPYTSNLMELPYFQIREPVTALEAVKEVFRYGIDISGSFYPVYTYVYTNTLSTDNFTLVIKPVNFEQQAVGFIESSITSKTIDVNFSEMYTQIKVYFDNPDGIKEETTVYYTNNPHTTPREKYITASNIEMGEADIIAQLHADLENNFKNQRSITVKFDEIRGAVGTSPVAAWRIRAGDYIYISTPTNTHFNSQISQDVVKFFVNKTTVDPIAGEITLDLGFETDKERFLELLGG